jgi:hypothetical protein
MNFQVDSAAVRWTRIEQVGCAWAFLCIVAGGLVAAVTRPLSFDEGSWVAAYLVLVGGIAGLLLARQRLLLDADVTAVAGEHLRVTVWTVGNVLVVAGTLVGMPVIVDVGGLALMIALVSALAQTGSARSIGLAWLVRIFYVAVLVSVPVGLVLAQLRA